MVTTVNHVVSRTSLWKQVEHKRDISTNGTVVVLKGASRQMGVQVKGDLKLHEARNGEGEFPKTTKGNPGGKSFQRVL